VPFAIGSETSGSIVIPAAFCGITGLRPTYGLVSRYGAMPLSWTMDKIGPMCRSAEDCGLVLSVIAGKDNNDLGTAGKSFYYFPKYHRDVKTMRVGYSPADFDQWAQESARPAFREALDVFRRMGVQLHEVPALPDLPYWPLTDPIESGKVDELADARQIAGLKAGLAIEARDYLRAMRVRRLVQMELRKLLTDIDMLLAPAHYRIASPLKEPLDRSTPPPPGAETLPGGMRGLIPAGNLAGYPALTLPCGFADGLPDALQLVSRPFTENPRKSSRYEPRAPPSAASTRRERRGNRDTRTCRRRAPEAGPSRRSRHTAKRRGRRSLRLPSPLAPPEPSPSPAGVKARLRAE
jgi:aspartyl-tRNA(Asn)/glutamyl-tRNA(Gln) amidotransferase subunit A